jgi:hypothetical protein
MQGSEVRRRGERKRVSDVEFGLLKAHRELMATVCRGRELCELRKDSILRWHGGGRLRVQSCCID